MSKNHSRTRLRASSLKPVTHEAMGRPAYRAGRAAFPGRHFGHGPGPRYL
jgi:hypothetical protein